MEERLCSFETSVVAKEKGFKEKVLYCYLTDTQEIATLSELYTPGREWLRMTEWNTNYGNKIAASAPTQSLLQKWLRDNYDIFVSVQRIPTGSDEWEFSYIIEYLPQDKRDVKRRCPEFRYNFTLQRWNDWEDALEEGFKEGLKLI